MRFLSLLAIGLLAAPALHAQTTTVSSLADYAGPRYPGGPDSLRALVYRSTRQAGAAPAGHALVQFELKPDGQPEKYTVVTLPGRANKPLAEAVASAQRYLQAHMLSWQPASPDPEVKSAATKAKPLVLILDFSTASAAQPYLYADEMPVFGTLHAVLNALPDTGNPLLNDPAWIAKIPVDASGLQRALQVQVRYPAAALRAHEQGTVYVYFDINPDGTVENREVLSLAGRSLDAEVQRVLATIPNATAPARLHGQPVRVKCILPLTFKIM
jgi:periplasmic protein TonB